MYEIDVVNNAELISTITTQIVQFHIEAIN